LAVKPRLNESSFSKRYDPYEYKPVSVEVPIKERIVMRKKTNFEQVPLEVVKRVVEEQVKQEETSEADRGVKKEELDHLQQLLLAASTPNRIGRRA
jgi:hypothetical protein